MKSSEARQILSPSAETSLATRIKRLLKEYRPNGFLTSHQVAELADVSVRTLQRRLADEEISFSQVVEAARFEVAKDLLEHRKSNMQQIAEEVGYTNVSNFSRAFKRFTGKPPSTYLENEK